MSVRFTAFLISLSVALSLPVAQFRDVESVGPSGILNVKQRWRDTVGTATQVYMNGPATKNTVLHTSRTGPLSPVYRDALSSVREPCQITDDQVCEVAANGFGTTGEVIYDFYDARKNVAGRSSQVMVACRCVDSECGRAVLIRPVSLYEQLPAAPDSSPVRRTCLYEAVDNNFSDCHTELLRSVRRSASRRLEYDHGGENFVYNVDDPSLEANWTARGQRGWTRDCLVSDISSFETATMQDFNNSIQQNDHETPANNGCKPPDESIQYFVEEDPAAGEACYRTYEFASTAASHVASQQDEIAIGNHEDTYVGQKPELVSDTELALSCSAAGLGVLFVWGWFRKQLKKRNTSAVYLATVIAIQILSYALEALPLHMALGQEIDARSWQSEFAFIDGTVALASDQLDLQGSAEGSVLMLTAVLGTVQYHITRVNLVAGFAVSFDVVAVALILATLVKKRQFLKEARAKGKLTNEKKGWMSHIVGFRSRELQRRESRRFTLQAVVQQARALSVIQNLANPRADLQSKASTDIGAESQTVDASSTHVSEDGVEDVFDVMGFGESLDVEGAFTEGMRRRGSASSQHADLSDLPQNEGTQADGSQADGSQADGSQADGSQADGSQADGSQADGSQADGSQIEPPLQDSQKDGRQGSERV